MTGYVVLQALYAIAIVACLCVGERQLQRFGPRAPMIWGSLIVGVPVACLMPTNLTLGAYKILAVPGFTLFGLGLAYLRSRTESLYPCVLLHSGFNAAALVLSLTT